MLRKFNAARGSTPYRRVAALLFAFLWGCGGGGGGGGPAGLTPPPSTPVAVTANNATRVSATALKPAVGGGGDRESTRPNPRRITSFPYTTLFRSCFANSTRQEGLLRIGGSRRCSSPFFGGVAEGAAAAGPPD